MAEFQAIHECLFCPQTFETAASKDDHVLEHFAQETCVECNRNLIRIGGSLYTKHDASICVEKSVKIEDYIDPAIAEPFSIKNLAESGTSSRSTANVRVKMEHQQNTFDDDSTAFTGQNQSCSSDSESNNSLKQSNCSARIESQDRLPCSKEMILERTVCKNEVEIETDSSKQNDAIFVVKCEICGMKLSSSLELSKHKCTEKMNETIKKSRFTCEICKRCFAYKQSLQRHQLRLHPSTIITCKLCNECFDSKEERNIHSIKCIKRKSTKLNGKNHSLNNKKSKCTKCSATFGNESLLESHDCPHKDAYLCSNCKKNFSGPTAFRLHQIRFHSQGAIFCSICGHLFSTIDERDKHQLDCTLKRKISQQKLMGRFECDICKIKIKTKASLRRHMLTKHNPNADKFKCKLCGAVFMKESTHQDHLCRGKRQNTEQSRLLPCESCGKVLSRGALNTHILIFHRPGTLYCRTCFKIYPSIDELDAHRKTCILKSRLSTKRPCHICGQVLSGIKSLARHKISKHSPPGTLFCKTCTKKFKTIEELNAHIIECSLKRKIKRSKKY